jgi:hypothetical protein
MQHFALLVIGLALTACATAVVGPYANSLSADDTQQIHELVAARSDMPKVILSIHAIRKDCVYVETSLPVRRAVEVSFTACKHHGKWHINERSVEKWRAIITA